MQWLNRYYRGEIDEGSNLADIARMIAAEFKVSYAAASDCLIEWLRQNVIKNGDIEHTVDGCRMTLGECTIFVPKKPVFWRGAQWERRPYYRFSFWFKDTVIVSHLGDKDASFIISPHPTTDDKRPEALIESVAHFMTLRPGDTDDEFFDGYDLLQAIWCTSFECQQFGSCYYDRFKDER